MEDEALVPLDCKGLGNLRVVDLKQELEKRGLSKSGSKKDLVKRLKQVSLICTLISNDVKYAAQNTELIALNDFTYVRHY